MTLRIGLDARPLALERPTGVERVLYHFVESLRRVVPSDQEWIPIVDEPPTRGAAAELVPDALVVPTRFPRLQGVADFWMALQMRRAMRQRELDVFLSMNTKFPFTSRPVVTTVHGLEWAFTPDDYSSKERLKQRFWFRLCTRRSRGLVTFAHHTEGDIRRLAPRCELPVRVVPEGVGPRFRPRLPHEKDPACVAELGARPPYVLSVCSLEPRKNLDALIRAFARAKHERDLPHQLVLVGRAGWDSTRLDAAIEEVGLGGDVHRTGYVTDEQLVDLYNHADLFAYVSKYEGFGLPVVEAMACATPVLTADASATREVAGDAALLADPHSVDDIAEKLGRALADPALRASLTERGFERSARFSWDRMTSEICSFVAECARRA